MLEYLRIRNLALIDDLEIDLGPGLNVITGETGAGKSFILRALDFLTGERLRPDMVRQGGDKAVVEALFVLDGEERVIRRELSAETGRSRAWMDDSLSSQEAIKALRPSLVLHTSQHSQQRLLSPAYQARLLDGFADRDGLGAERDRLLGELRAVAAKRRELEDRVAEIGARRELLEFQKTEIDKVSPAPGEEDELVSRKRIIQARARAAEAVDQALETLHGPDGGLLRAMDELSSQVDELARLANNDGADNDNFGNDDIQKKDSGGYAGQAEFLAEARERLRDLDATLRRESPDADARELERVESRLFELSKLKRKLGRSLEEITGLAREIGESLSLLDSCALDLKRLDERMAALAKELGKVLDNLNAARREAAGTLAESLARDLRGLGFSGHAGVVFDFEPREIWPGLAEDRARLLWIPNPGHAPQPLERIASGGELSRFTLALAGLMSRDELPTLVFDEVDAGIGGLTLNSVADRLEALSQGQQVVLITHWPQLAARALRHFHVQKDSGADSTAIRCLRLDAEQVRQELARMAGGGDTGRAMARRLLDS